MGKRVALARERSGLSVGQAARVLAVPRGAVEAMEADVRLAADDLAPGTLHALAVYLANRRWVETGQLPSPEDARQKIVCRKGRLPTDDDLLEVALLGVW